MSAARAHAHSLRARAIVPALLSALALALAAFYVFEDMGDRTVALRAQTRMRMFAHVAASAALHAGSNDDLAGTIHAIADEPSVELLLVAGGTPPRVLASTCDEWRDRPLGALADSALRAFTLGTLAAHRPPRVEREPGDEFRYGYGFPMRDGSRGAVLVHLDARGIRADIVAWLWRVVVVIAVLFASALLLADRILHRNVLAPVAAIATAARRHRDGDRDVRVPVHADDEIGHLARTVNDAFDAASAALRELEFQKVALDQAAGVVVTDADGNVLDVNAACCRLTGLTTTALKRAALAPDGDGAPAPEFYRELRASLHDGRVRRGEICDRRPDGTIYWVAATIIPSLDPDDRIERCTAILIDVTARKLAEAAARENELRVRQILATSLDAVITIDSSHRILEWNGQAEQMFGWTADEAIGRTLTETIVPQQFRRAHERGMARYIATGEGPALGQRIELSGLRRNGEEFPIEIAINTVPGAEGGGAAFSAFIRDIGDRKRAEAELVRARDAAQAANRAKSEFLATMSHEIRTPMNGVIGFTSLLLDTELDGPQRDFAETIRSSGRALLEIIDDILDLSKIEAGRLDVERQPFDAHDAAADVVGLLTARAEEHGLELVFDWAPHVPHALVGDAKRFRQVLLNLAGNAIKFTESGTVAVRVEPAADEALRVSVDDTGAGIAHDKLPLLFRKFSQADSSTTRRFGGTGLGLAISKQLVELMGGSIGVESRPGSGSTFWFTLPLAPAEAAPAPPAAPLAGLRVLVVDDLAANRRVLRDQLVAWGATAAVAGDTAEALTTLRAGAARGEPWHAALLDHELPDGTGEALGLAVRADATAGAPALLLCVTAAQRGEATRLREQGFADVFVKPIVRPEALFAALARIAGVEPPAERPGHDAGVAPAVSNVAITGRRVLLAEDNAVNQKLALRVLRRAGCVVDVAANGAEACEFASMNDYDVVFMDCHMPEMDGFAASRTIRAREAATRDGRRTPIVALTASVLNSDRQRCLDSGMDDFIAKPFQPAQLEDAVRRWCDDDAASEGPAREAA